MSKSKGLFITFEGTEGSGKSTQIKRAVQFLKNRGHRVLILREPGGTRISESVRKVILNKKFREMTQETELLLYLACRAQILREKILPALSKGVVVICDRFEDSTLAYQGYGRGIPLAKIREVSRLFVRGNLRPDLIFLLDMDPVEGMKRGGRNDRIEKESIRFHQRVRRGYLAMAKKERNRYVVLKASESKDALTKKIKERLIDAVGKS
ncbi:MAG: dTMP kinase [Candidatus Omnitrophica bacterium]|nr:dTMP kinase [Candidatus Omnitrophota bacterium]